MAEETRDANVEREARRCLRQQRRMTPAQGPAGAPDTRTPLPSQTAVLYGFLLLLLGLGLPYGRRLWEYYHIHVSTDDAYVVAILFRSVRGLPGLCSPSMPQIINRSRRVNCSPSSTRATLPSASNKPSRRWRWLRPRCGGPNSKSHPRKRARIAIPLGRVPLYAPPRARSGKASCAAKKRRHVYARKKRQWPPPRQRWTGAGPSGYGAHGL